MCFYNVISKSRQLKIRDFFISVESATYYLIFIGITGFSIQIT